MATEKKIIKVEPSKNKKASTKKKGGIDLNAVKDFVVENKDTIVKVVEVAGAAIAAKKAKDALTGKKKTTAKKKTTKKTSDDPLSTITDLAGKFLKQKKLSSNFELFFYSTVTDFARFLGLSTSRPLETVM